MNLKVNYCSPSEVQWYVLVELCARRRLSFLLGSRRLNQQPDFYDPAAVERSRLQPD